MQITAKCFVSRIVSRNSNIFLANILIFTNTSFYSRVNSRIIEKSSAFNDDKKISETADANEVIDM